MKRYSKYQNLISFILVMAVIISWYLYFFGHAVLSPNQVMHSGEQDGLKNYYTFAYHTENSDVSLNFEGMNYPYGEHIIYTDGQPLFGLLLGLLPLKGYEVGILNSIMYLSILFAAFLIWKILIILHVRSWTAAAGTVGIILLSPQFFRLGGHYALSLMWVIPLVIYQLIKIMNSDRQIGQSLIMAITILGMFFIHPYLGLMSLVFAVLTIFMFGLYKQINWKVTILSMLIVGSSALLFKMFLIITDTHVSRIEQPHGLFENYALAETIFVPYFSPFKVVLESLIPVRHGQPFEGWGYIGFTTMMILLSTGLGWFATKLRKIDTTPREKHSIKPIFVAALLVLLFSMLIPLKWFPEELVYKLKVFNQFRSVGRFSWVFYYVSGITAIVILDRMFLKYNGWRKKAVVTVILLFPLLNMVESHEAYSFFCSKNGVTPNLFLEKNVKTRKGWAEVLDLLRKESNAVILPLPFFHVGSEHAMRVGTNEVQQLTMVMSYHAKIPTFASFLSRTSVSETIAIFKLLAPEWNDGTLKNGVEQKKILILTTNQDLDQYEQKLLDASKPLYKGDHIGLYKLNYLQYVREVKRNLSNRIQKCKVKSQFASQNQKSIDSSIVLAESYEGRTSEHVFAGRGALKVKKAKYSHLATLCDASDDTLTASFWYYKGQSGLYNAMVIVEEIDTIANSGRWKVVTDANRFPVFRDDWVLVEVPVIRRKGAYKYNLLIVGNSESQESFFIDNLIIRRSQADWIMEDAQWYPKGYKVLFNNVPFRNW